MKILVFSDTHGRTGGMLRAIAAHDPDTVLHLGDCAEDMKRVEKDYPMLPILKVCGNCDDYPHEQETREVSLGGMKLFMAHGHRHRVKWDLEPMLLAGPVPVKRIKLVATDGATNYRREYIDAMDDETFSKWMEYHFTICERQDLIGASHHTLDMLRKE